MVVCTAFLLSSPLSRRGLCALAPMLVSLAAGCGGDDPKAGGGDAGGDTGPSTDGPREIDRICPGDAGCASNAGPLRAGAARRDITPCFEQWVDSNADLIYRPADDVFFDCGCDQRCPTDAGYPGPDEKEANGIFDAAWIAGFGQGRAANSVHDPIEARVLYLASGETSVAIVTLDVVGWFFDDTNRVRAAVTAAGVDVDLVVVHATHNHEAPDTMGQWGERFGKRGVDNAWRDAIVADAAEAVAEAAASAVPVRMTAGAADVAAPFGGKGSRNTVRDSRDPVVIDEQVYAIHLVAESGGTVATLVNWGNHPEVLSGDNTALTSDFVHYLRNGIEDGVPSTVAGDRAGLGGTAIFVNASVGGLMTPLGITVTDWDGVDHSGDTFEKAKALGDVVAGVALDAVLAGGAVDAPTLAFKAEGLNIPVQNVGFQALFLTGVFERELLGYDPDQPLSDSNVPLIRTEMDLIELGPVRILTVPGELFPELAIGGYDGSRVHSDEVALVDPGNEVPPNLAAAPAGPYIKDRMGAEFNLIMGLGNDEIGYLVPPYDYVLSTSAPYLSEAPGDHYEETNSVGPAAVPAILGVAALLTAESR
jgi:hypothetical protein